MSDNWLTVEEAAKRIGCSKEIIQAMLNDGFILGEQTAGQWHIEESVASQLKEVFTKLKLSQSLPISLVPEKIDLGMVEVSIALAGIAAAVATILPSLSNVPEEFRALVAILSGFLAILSTYSALRLLASYTFGGHSLPGFMDILKLLSSQDKVGLYWLLAIALVAWLALSLLLVYLVVI